MNSRIKQLVTVGIIPAILFLLSLTLPAPVSAETPSPLLAPPGTCGAETDQTASTAKRLRSMRCLTNFARRNAGLVPVSADSRLNTSAWYKAGDIFRCDVFSHYACERPFTYWIEQTGFLEAPCWHAGENLAFETASLSTPRSIFQAWMRSPKHRENILDSRYRFLGITLRIGTLEGFSGTRVWVQHFGDYCPEAIPAPS